MSTSDEPRVSFGDALAIAGYIALVAGVGVLAGLGGALVCGGTIAFACGLFFEVL